jgi:hypothetical protein
MRQPSGVVTMMLARSRFASRSTSSGAFVFGLTVLGPAGHHQVLGRCPRAGLFKRAAVYPAEHDAMVGQDKTEAMAGAVHDCADLGDAIAEPAGRRIGVDELAGVPARCRLAL